MSSRRTQILLAIITGSALCLGGYLYRKDRRLGAVVTTVPVTLPPEAKVDESREIPELERRIAAGNSPDAVQAVKVLATFDATRHDAFLLLMSAALDGVGDVRMDALQGLKHFPNFVDEAVPAMLTKTGPNNLAYWIGPTFQERAIPALMREISGPPDRAAEAASALEKILMDSSRAPDSAVLRDLQSYEKSLIDVLETSHSNRVQGSVRYLLLVTGTPEGRAASFKNFERRQVEDQRAAEVKRLRETTPQTREQVMAEIHPSPDPEETLRFSSTWNLLPDDDALVVTLHESERKDQRLEIWFKQDDRYQPLRSISTDSGVSNFEPSKVLQFANQTFYLVPVRFSGSGQLHEYHIYHVDRGAHSLQDVEFRRDPTAYKLEPGESVYKGPFFEFNDNKISFWFRVERRNTCNGCPDFHISGNYIIEKTDDNAGWVMKPVQVTRG